MRRTVLASVFTTCASTCRLKQASLELRRALKRAYSYCIHTGYITFVYEALKWIKRFKVTSIIRSLKAYLDMQSNDVQVDDRNGLI